MSKKRVIPLQPRSSLFVEHDLFPKTAVDLGAIQVKPEGSLFSGSSADVEAQREAEAPVEMRVVVIGLVGVAELEVKKADLLIVEERPGMPGATVELDGHRARYHEGRDVFERGLGLRIIERLGRRHRHQPRLAAE